jgi:hypothetical protein
MILPRYSLRTLLIAMVVCALISLVVRQASLGRAWAIGLSVTIAAAFVVILSHMLMFALANLLVAIRKGYRKPEVGRSPFASAGLPRQVVAPIDPE